MTSLEYLEQIYALKARQEAALIEITDMKERAVSLRGIDYSGDKVQTSPEAGAAHERMINAAADRERELQELLDEIELKKLEIAKAIEVLPPELSAVLYMYYVKGWNRERISQEMHYSMGHVSRLKKAALREWNKVYECKDVT